MEYVANDLNGVDDDVLESYDADYEEAAPSRNKTRGRPAPVAYVRSPAISNGVSSARLHTASGSATVQLPHAVPTREDLERTSEQLESAINRATRGVNATQSDLDDLSGMVSAVRARQKKLEKGQAQQNMMSLVITLLTQQQSQKALDEHKHTVLVNGQSLPTSTAVAGAAADNKLTALLPLLLMGGMGGGEGEGLGGGGTSSMLLLLALTGGFK